MSWSISVSGPLEVVTKELTDALRVIENGLEHLAGHKVEAKDTVSVCASGHVARNDDGVITGSSTGHTVSVTPYVAPKPQAAVTDAEAAAPAQS